MQVDNLICASCECPALTHAYFHKCELFNKKEVCIDCSRDTPIAEFLSNVKKHTNKEVTAEDIKTICKDASHISL